MYPTLFSTPGVKKFAEAVDAERQAQLAKFGDQKHPDGTGSASQQDAAGLARLECEDAFASGYGTWYHVLFEEVREALAESDPAALRAELLQVAAVCAAWIYDIDTRPHSMICAQCGKPIPTHDYLPTWHGPVPAPGQPECTVPRYHLGREYPDCRNAGGTDTAEQPAAAATKWQGATELVPDSEVQRLAATGLVGYQQNGGRLLHCLSHKPAPASRYADFHEVSADDLPDGGICVHPRCGVDVLITPTPFTEAEPAAAEADDAALEAEFPGEAAEEKYPASIGIYCDRCGTSAERDYVVSDRMTRQQRFAAARRHLTANEGWQCTAAGDLCPGCRPATTEGAQL